MMEILEGGIIYHIYSKFLKKGYQFTDSMCRGIALAFWNKYPEYRIAQHFSASYKWIKRFKVKYGLVNRKAHYHRRSDCAKSTAKMYHEKMIALYNKHKEEGTLALLLNIDETNWMINGHRDITWGKIGSEHIEFSGTFPEKDSLTAIAAISADPDNFKLPLCIIREGKTNQSKKILTSIEQYFQIEISESGWSTVRCFANYLIWLRAELNERYKKMPNYSNDTKIDIILDLYATHRNSTIKRLASSLNFELHFIPAGLTDSFQPLDRYIFGALKSMARKEWNIKYALDPEKGCTIIDACIILVRCWNRINPSTQRRAWNPYSCPEECDIDSLVRSKTIEIDIKSSELNIDDVKLYDETLFSQTDEKKSSGFGKRHQDNLDITDDYRLECIRGCKDFDKIDQNDLKEVIDYEEYLLDLNNKRTVIKPIEKNSFNFSINVIIQLLGIIPGLFDRMQTLCKNNEFESNTLQEIETCMSHYFSNNVDKTIKGFTKNMISNNYMDTIEYIETVFKMSELKYGINTNNSSDYISVVHMFPINGEIGIEMSIQDVVGDSEYSLNKLIFFSKSHTINYKFPEITYYGNYILILKAVIATEKSRFFYQYIRELFESNFILVRDNYIEDADVDDIYMDTTCIAMYYILELHEKDIITESENDVIECEIDLTEKGDALSEEVMDILKEIDDNKHIHVFDNYLEERGNSKIVIYPDDKTREESETRKEMLREDLPYPLTKLWSGNATESPFKQKKN